MAFSEDVRGIVTILGIVLCFVSIMLLSIAGKQRWGKWLGTTGIGITIVIEGIAFVMWRQSIKAEKQINENKQLLWGRLQGITVEIEDQHFHLSPLPQPSKLYYGASLIGSFTPMSSDPNRSLTHSAPLSISEKKRLVSEIVSDTLHCVDRRNFFRAHLFYVKGEREDIVFLPLTEEESFALSRLPPTQVFSSLGL